MRRAVVNVLVLAAALLAAVGCAGSATPSPKTAAPASPAAAPPAASPAPATPAAASSAPSPSVDEIIDSHLRARGGAAKLHGLMTMRATGNAFFPGGKEAVIVREIARPGRIRLEIKYQGLSSVYAHDGQTAWEVSPMEGHFDPELLPASAGPPPVDQLDIEGPLLDWRAKGHTVTLAGRTRVGDRDAYDLEVQLKGGAVRHDLIDAETYQLLRVDTERIVAGRRVPVQMSFSDYRTVEGLSFPYRIETRRRGAPQELKIVVQTIELNPTIDESRFRMPAP